MARGDDQLRGVGGIRHSESAGIARDSRINFAVGRVHSELDEGAFGVLSLGSRLGRGLVGRAKNKISIDVRWRVGAIRQFLRVDIPGGVRVAGGWRRP